MKYRAFAILIVLTLLITVVPAVQAEDVELTAPFEDGTLVLKNNNLELYFTKDYSGLCLVDMRSGTHWYSQVQDDQFPEGARVNKTWQKRSQSLVMVNYTDEEASNGNVITTDIITAQPEINTDATSDRFDLNLNFSDIGLAFTLRFSLNESDMVVTIPFDSIQETSVNVLTKISLLPFFGSANDWDEGYILYPNGSGELYRFKDKKYRSNALTTLTLPVYAPHITEVTGFPLGVETDVRNDNSTFIASMPAFGVKRGNSAFAAVIEQGDNDSDIVITPGGGSLPVNNVYANLIYRNNYGSRGQEINVGGKTEVSFVSILTDRDIRAGDRVIRYTFLNDDSANYSGMANVIRTSFINRNILKRLEDSYNAVLDIFCSVEQQQVLTRELLNFTTFEQAEKIIQFFLENGYPSLSVNMKGWGNKGILGYPLYLPVNGSLGGEQGLKHLASFCEEKGVDLLLQMNTIKLKKGNTGFLTMTNSARDGNGYVYTVDVGEKTYYLQNTDFIKNNIKEVRDFCTRNGIKGITFEDVGSYIYDDFAGTPLMRSDFVDLWNSLLMNKDAVIGADTCMLNNIELVREVPEANGLTNLGDQTVPFYQMVVHGCVDYTGQPINLYYDDVEQLLQLVEFGYTPCFELTWDSVNKLSSTDYQMLFSSKFETWKDEVAVYAERFDELKDAIGTKFFTGHNKLSENVYESVFEDVHVLVNYGTEMENNIPAGTWILVKGDE